MVTVFLRLGIVKIEKETGLLSFLSEDAESFQERVIADTFGGQDYETILVKGQYFF